MVSFSLGLSILFLVILYFLSRSLTQAIYVLTFVLFGSRAVAISLVTLVLFPGTVIHELAHLFTAEIFGVRTGKLSLVPESIEENEIQSGSVQVAQTDPFRRAVIGLAPTVVGLVIVAILSYIIPGTFQAAVASLGRPVLENQSLILLIVQGYLLFALTTSMFPSPADFKGTPALGITLGIFLLASYFAGFRLSLTGNALNAATTITQSLSRSLLFVLALNSILLITLKFLIVLAGKLLHRRVLT